MWSFAVHDARTGDPLLPVTPSGGDCTRRITGNGSGSHLFKLLDEETGLDRATARDLFEPNRRLLAVKWDGYPVYAGFCQVADYERSTGTLTVPHVEFRQQLRYRLTYGVGNAGPIPGDPEGDGQGDLSVTARSHSGAARAAFARAMQWNSAWTLPIDLPLDGAGPFSAAWKWYDNKTIEDLLQEIEAEGYEVDLHPYLTSSGQLRFRPRIGAPIVEGAADLPVTAEESDVVDLKVKLDGTKQLTGVIMGGNGSEADKLLAAVGSTPGPDILIRDVYRSNDVTDPTALARIAAAELAADRYPIEQWSFGVNLAGATSPLDLLPGSVLQMDTYGDPWITDGPHPQRVVSLKVDMSTTATPEVQPHG